MKSRRATGELALTSFYVRCNRMRVNDRSLSAFACEGEFPLIHMEHGMASRILTPSLAIVAFLAFLFVTEGARAQNVGPDEAVKPDGSVSQDVALPTAQRSAIYNGAMQQQLHISGIGIFVAVGAPVPRSVELSDLPDQSAAGSLWANASAAYLRYALVENDIVVVDPPAFTKTRSATEGAALLAPRYAAEPARVGRLVLWAFIALVFHTLLYADFLEDPVAWVLLAVGVSLAVAVPASQTDRDFSSRARADLAAS